VLSAETVIAPRVLHSQQQIRTANYILQTSDPSGINAAGKGSNVGRSVVIVYSGEILKRAWDKTRDPRYLAGIEERAYKILDVDPQYTDDIAHRIMFFRRVFPADYAELKSKLPAVAESRKPNSENLLERIQGQLAQDCEALRRSQREDGAWGFAPGKVDSTADPSPTALAIDALAALGADRDDPQVARGVKALLAMQHPYGLWNRSAKTGFVTTSYVMHALSRLFPDQPDSYRREKFRATPAESLHDAIARLRQRAQRAPWSTVGWDSGPDVNQTSQETHPTQKTHLTELLEAAVHPSAFVRYWAMIALALPSRSLETTNSPILTVSPVFAP